MKSEDIKILEDLLSRMDALDKIVLCEYLKDAIQVELSGDIAKGVIASAQLKAAKK